MTSTSNSHSSVEQIALKEALEVTNEVYGEYENKTWSPKAFKDSKKRYLWTDAFGVVNYLSLYEMTKNQVYIINFFLHCLFY